MTNPFRGLRIGTRLFLIVLVMMLLALTSSAIVSYHFESDLLAEVKDQSESLSKALQISVQQMTSQGMTDESLLREYVQRLSGNGVKEILILSPEKQIVASSKGGEGLIITGTLAEEGIGDTEGKTSTTLDIPIIVDNEKRGYVRLHLLFDDLNEMIRATYRRRILATLTLFLFGMAGVVALSYRLARSLDEVVDAASRVAGGDLSVRVTTKRRDEIGRLIGTFNQMVERLREQRALEVRLRRAERTSAIGRLASAVAHEIRNPLNLISLSIGHLGTEYRPDDPARAEEYSRVVDSVRAELKRLNGMVSDFLSYGRPPRLTPRPCRIEEIIEEVLSLTAAKARAQGVEIVTRHAPDLHEISADVDGIRTCFLNVVDNALQAMPSGGKLTIEARQGRVGGGAGAVTVAFRDTGPGIAALDIDRILEPYFSTREAGMGLGLAITQRIIEEHGGRIRVESEPRVGTVFYLDVPVEPSLAKESAAVA